MDRNSPSSVLPSYMKYSKRDFAKASDKGYNAKESTFADIRKKIDSAVITVPYKKGLDHLRFFGDVERRRSPPSKNKNQNFDVVESKTVMSNSNSRIGSEGGSTIISGVVVVSPSRSPKSIDLSSFRLSERSKDSSSYLPRLSRTGRERAPSETSTTSTWSRPYSFSKCEFDENFWRRNLREIEDLKERYSENSEFMNSMYGFLEEEERKIREKREVFSPQKMTEKFRLRPSSLRSVDRRSETNSEYSERVSPRENKSSSPRIKKVIISPRESKNTHEQINNRIVHLPSLVVSEDDNKSTASTRTSISLPESCQTVNSKESRRTKASTKSRKVEFNLLPKRPLRLPPLKKSRPKRRHRPSKPKSILKKQEAEQSRSGTVDHESKKRYQNLKREDKNEQKISRESKFPHLFTPAPPSASRRNQIVFKRTGTNFQFKCSKEFQAAMGDFGE